jgi:hypothetical protein
MVPHRLAGSLCPAPAISRLSPYQRWGIEQRPPLQARFLNTPFYLHAFNVDVQHADMTLPLCDHELVSDCSILGTGNFVATQMSFFILFLFGRADHLLCCKVK